MRPGVLTAGMSLAAGRAEVATIVRAARLLPRSIRVPMAHSVPLVAPTPKCAHRVTIAARRVCRPYRVRAASGTIALEARYWPRRRRVPLVSIAAVRAYPVCHCRMLVLPAFIVRVPRPLPRVTVRAALVSTALPARHPQLRSRVTLVSTAQRARRRSTKVDLWAQSCRHHTSGSWWVSASASLHLLRLVRC